ncbi:MAG: toll/interleukin-1 receptor domain-containing protein [Candidatus Thiodiazotropha sp.]
MTNQTPTINVITCGPAASDWTANLQISLADSLHRLELPEDLIHIEPYNGSNLLTGNLILYMSDRQPATEAQLEAQLADLLDQENEQTTTVIMPIVDALDKADRHLPTVLHKINAFALGKNSLDYSKLVGRILDLLWHRRRERKVFISYRRTESQEVARQLQARLTNSGYEVFLDETTIPPGTDFQKALKNWMNDADFVLLLATPQLESSEWVVEEIEFANLASVGLLAVVWPGEIRANILQTLMPDQIFDLSEKCLQDMDGNEASISNVDLGKLQLKKQTIDKLLEHIDSYRLQAIQRRLINILPSLHEWARRNGITPKPGTHFGDFWLKSTTQPTANSHLIRVFPFRPTLGSVWDLHQDLEVEDNMSSDHPISRASCFYFENDVHNMDYQMLNWILEMHHLNEHEGLPNYALIPYCGQPIDLT